MNNMKQSWLIQRLEKPRRPGLLGPDNPFAFGGGLVNGGLSSEAMSLLRGIFSFDYMGAAEFEWGAVPKALQALASDQLVAESLTIPLATVARDFRDKGPDPEGEGTIYVLCRREHLDGVKERIKALAAEGYKADLKEPANLASTLRPVNEWDGRVVGWLELDNGFFFSTDREMWSATSHLFGVQT